MKRLIGISNIEFFRKESPNFFYYLGLMATDGCIQGTSVQIGLTDKEVIDWIAQTLGYRNTITKSPGLKAEHKTRYWLRFMNKEVANKLRLYGVTANKTYSLRMNLRAIPQAMLRHIIRGAFDGDGSVNNAHHGVEANICSHSLEFIEQVRDIINEALHFGYEITRTEWTKGTYLYTYRIYGVPHVSRFAEWIYDGDYYGMSRKRDAFAGIIEEANKRKLRGAYWKKDKQKWRAQIKVDKKCLFLGYFTTEEEAAMSYDQAAVKHFGRRAILNFPELIYGTAGATRH